MKYDYAVKTEDLARYYSVGGTLIKALDEIELKIDRGEYVSIVGPSGSGKSTLFNLIGGLDRPTKGRVFVGNVDIGELDAYELAWFRCRKIGYIFQTFNLIPVLTSVENVALPMIFAGVISRPGCVEAGRPSSRFSWRGVWWWGWETFTPRRPCFWRVFARRHRRRALALCGRAACMRRSGRSWRAP